MSTNSETKQFYWQLEHFRKLRTIELLKICVRILYVDLVKHVNKKL